MPTPTVTAFPPFAQPLARLLLQQARWSARERFGWLIDDVLADLTGQRKDRPPPGEALPLIRELAGTYARCVADAPPFEDVLGPLYIETVCRNDQRYRGQFFTPQAIAGLMAEVVGPGEAEVGPRPDGDLWRLCEPACGSGVMILAFLQTLLARGGRTAVRHWSVTAIDLDGDCARMTAAQLLANALIHQTPPGEILVYRGNALGPASDLTVVVHATAPTLPPDTVLPARHPARIEALQAAARSQGRDLFGLPEPDEAAPDEAARAA